MASPFAKDVERRRIRKGKTPGERLVEKFLIRDKPLEEETPRPKEDEVQEQRRAERFACWQAGLADHPIQRKNTQRRRSSLQTDAITLAEVAAAAAEASAAEEQEQHILDELIEDELAPEMDGRRTSLTRISYKGSLPREDEPSPVLPRHHLSVHRRGSREISATLHLPATALTRCPSASKIPGLEQIKESSVDETEVETKSPVKVSAPLKLVDVKVEVCESPKVARRKFVYEVKMEEQPDEKSLSKAIVLKPLEKRVLNTKTLATAPSKAEPIEKVVPQQSVATTKKPVPAATQQRPTPPKTLQLVKTVEKPKLNSDTPRSPAAKGVSKTVQTPETPIASPRTRTSTPGTPTSAAHKGVLPVESPVSSAPKTVQKGSLTPGTPTLSVANAVHSSFPGTPTISTTVIVNGAISPPATELVTKAKPALSSVSSSGPPTSPSAKAAPSVSTLGTPTSPTSKTLLKAKVASSAPSTPTVPIAPSAKAMGSAPTTPTGPQRQLKVVETDLGKRDTPKPTTTTTPAGKKTITVDPKGKSFGEDVQQKAEARPNEGEVNAKNAAKLSQDTKQLKQSPSKTEFAIKPGHKEKAVISSPVDSSKNKKLDGAVFSKDAAGQDKLTTPTKSVVEKIGLASEKLPMSGEKVRSTPKTTGVKIAPSQENSLGSDKKEGSTPYKTVAGKSAPPPEKTVNQNTKPTRVSPPAKKKVAPKEEDKKQEISKMQITSPAKETTKTVSDVNQTPSFAKQPEKTALKEKPAAEKPVAIEGYNEALNFPTIDGKTNAAVFDNDDSPKPDEEKAESAPTVTAGDTISSDKKPETNRKSLEVPNGHPDQTENKSRKRKKDKGQKAPDIGTGRRAVRAVPGVSLLKNDGPLDIVALNRLRLQQNCFVFRKQFRDRWLHNQALLEKKEEEKRKEAEKERRRQMGLHSSSSSDETDDSDSDDLDSTETTSEEETSSEDEDEDADEDDEHVDEAGPLPMPVLPKVKARISTSSDDSGFDSCPASLPGSAALELLQNNVNYGGGYTPFSNLFQILGQLFSGQLT